MPANLVLLTESDLVPAIVRLAGQSTTWRVAVGYCGEAAYGFFPESPAEWTTDFRVLVDASEAAVGRGLTNPQGLGRLLGMGAVVKSLPGLHAKVFSFDGQAAIVGSANLSDGAITQQRQCAIQVTNSGMVARVNRWFDGLWTEAGNPLDADRLRELQRLWPSGHRLPAGPKTKAKAPTWRKPAPEPPLPDVEFEIGISKAALKETFRRFERTPCAYHDDGRTCADTARGNERWYRDESENLHRLYRRRQSWTADDLEHVFRLAYLNGRAALMFVPRFRRLAPHRVAATLEFLFEGPGDPFVRLEQVLAGHPHELPRLGMAGYACLMHLWDPKRFAIFNQPVMDALKSLKVRAGRTRTHGVAARYRNLCSAMQKLTADCGLKNLSRADHFFDGIGKKHFTVARG